MRQLVEVYGWMIRGFGGCINWLELFTTEGESLNEHWLGELRKYRDRLNLIIQVQEKRVQ